MDLALMSSSHRIGALIGSLGSGFVIHELGIAGLYVLIAANVHSGVGGADGDPGGGTVGGGASAACVREPYGLDEAHPPKTGCCSP